MGGVPVRKPRMSQCKVLLLALKPGAQLTPQLCPVVSPVQFSDSKVLSVVKELLHGFPTQFGIDPENVPSAEQVS